MTIFFLAALGAVVVGFVLIPVFGRGAELEPLERQTESEREYQRLAEKKDQLLTSIKDLEFEHRAGKLSDADYQKVRADELSQVAAIMARMEELGAEKKAVATEGKAPPKTDSTKVEAIEEETGEVSCPACQKTNPLNAKFCLHCGSRIESSLQCPKCKTKLSTEARFCTECGATVQREQK